MGTPYQSQSASGYNSSPPSDDGSTTSSNQITWAGIKTKLADAIKNYVDNINSQLVTALSTTNSTTSTNYTTIVSDNGTAIEVSSGATISLGDAGTMTNNYSVTVIAVGADVPVNLITSGNTLDGTANGSTTVPAGTAKTFKTIYAATGYTSISSIPPAKNLAYYGTASGTNTITVTASDFPKAYALGQKLVFIPAATNTGATTINVNTLGAKNIYFGNAACVGGELMINVPVTVLYDGTQFQIITPALRSKIITFTRNLATGSGNVSYTGVGFQPTSIILFGGINANGIATYIGFSDSGRNAADLYLDGTATSTIATGGGGAIITTTTTTTAYQVGVLYTYDSDGFTLGWTKTNSPTGTVTYYALCLR